MDFLLGITAGDWIRLLRENHFAIPPKYWGRAAQVTLLSLLNSRGKRKEEKTYGEQIRAAEIKSPLFIVGHWRSGTTLLHNLLALDERFAYPALFQMTHPHTFLIREELFRKHLAGAAPESRPMDNMQVTFESPGEDESALAMVSLRSPLIGWSFPKRMAHYRRFLNFRETTPADVRCWQESLVWFMKKLTVRYQKPLVLKSPNNTARVKLLLELFPDARFVHIYRDPYTVFQSTQRLYEKTMPGMNLQNFSWDDIYEEILAGYKAMYDAFFADKKLIPANQLCEVRFEEFEKDIVNQLGRIYATLAIPGFNELKPKVQSYVESLSGYQKNKFTALPEKMRLRVEEVWQRNFIEWDYPLLGATVSERHKSVEK